jgi:hypothetical protein
MTRMFISVVELYLCKNKATVSALKSECAFYEEILLNPILGSREQGT